MNIASKAEVRIDRLDDESYIVTKKDSNTYNEISESCRTEGEMVGVLLRAIMPYSDNDFWQRVQDVASTATVSIDKAIEDWEKHP